MPWPGTQSEAIVGQTVPLPLGAVTWTQDRASFASQAAVQCDHPPVQSKSNVAGSVSALLTPPAACTTAVALRLTTILLLKATGAKVEAADSAAVLSA